MPFIKDSIEPGSIVHTDGSAAYRLLSKNGYRRMKTVMHVLPDVSIRTQAKAASQHNNCKYSIHSVTTMPVVWR